MADEQNTNDARPGRLSDHLSLGVIARVYRRDLIDEVLIQTRRREQRSRLLPSRLVVCYVIALGLFFGEAYEEVMRRMVGGLRFVNAWERHWHVPTTSALCQARQRVGEAPLKELFDRAAVPVASKSTIGAWLRDWRLMAIDGVVLDVPDTPDNDAEFGRSTSRTGQGSAYPQVRAVGLGEAGTHAIVAAELGPYRTGERELARGVLYGLAQGMLALCDRGFYSYEFFGEAADTGADLLWRVSKNLTLPVLRRFNDDSYLSVITPAAAPKPTSLSDAQRRVEAGKARLVRVIEYHITDRDDAQEYRLITTIVDPDAAGAVELAACYCQRWEFEIALDEIETHQIGHSRVLRSKSPEMVRQEIWGILLAHYAIRTLMTEAAHEGDADPDRLSFMQALRVIRREAEGTQDFPPSRP